MSLVVNLLYCVGVVIFQLKTIRTEIHLAPFVLLLNTMITMLIFISADLRYGHQIPQTQQYYQSQPQQQQQSRHPQAFPVSPGLGGRKFMPQNQQQFDIQTIKEDPDMPESDILVN